MLALKKYFITTRVFVETKNITVFLETKNIAICRSVNLEKVFRILNSSKKNNEPREKKIPSLG
jgi:hypothetical protein